MSRGDKGKEELSVEKLMEFLNDRQRDPRLNEILYPHYNAQRAKEIIITHEPDKELVQRGKALAFIKYEELSRH